MIIYLSIIAVITWWWMSHPLRYFNALLLQTHMIPDHIMYLKNTVPTRQSEWDDSILLGFSSPSGCKNTQSEWDDSILLGFSIKIHTLNGMTLSYWGQ